MFSKKKIAMIGLVGLVVLISVSIVGAQRTTFFDFYVSEEKLTEELETLETEETKNEGNTDILQHTMVDIFARKNENESINEDMLKMLEDANVDNELKTKIVSSSEFTNKDADLLIHLFRSDDGLLAFHSMKALSNVDSKQAGTLAWNVLKDREVISND